MFAPLRPPIRAITLDLDDTLWPIWPTIQRAEAALHAWLQAHAPATAALWGPQRLRALRNEVERERPDLAHDLSAFRREAIRRALAEAGDPETLVAPAFEVFFAERQKVDLFDDALPALAWLSARFPLVALTNGNADLNRVGLAQYFTGAVSAKDFGVAKPHPSIFLEACRVAGHPPEQVLHVGDDWALDVEGALSANMQVAWLNRQNAQGLPEKKPVRSVGTLHELIDLLLSTNFMETSAS
jgi:putative hydrolase of the HAD superfamily